MPSLTPQRRDNGNDFIDVACSSLLKRESQSTLLNDSHTTQSTWPTAGSEEFWNLELDDVLLLGKENETNVVGGGPRLPVVSFGTVAVREFEWILEDNDVQWSSADKAMTVDDHEAERKRRKVSIAMKDHDRRNSHGRYPCMEEKRRATSIAHFETLLDIHQIDLAYLPSSSALQDVLQPVAPESVKPKRFWHGIRRHKSKSTQ
ncbi:expressed unknown protein [Seminavis robusta]|uniref:Uncharacterized protein n=1 Tax=Seminavis robusta TaxID=568900 RepID=A0A9N8E0Z3_9STRA|nr:expressed unknown protein [Seminavis robusta]|eukprot:Sro514_g158080.1 n/a (204) ;mRNA; f:32356-32967